MTITEALIAEHSGFCAVFDCMERALPSLTTLPEVKVLTGQLEGMMVGHSEEETDLALVALDHILAQRGRLDYLHEDHRQMDQLLRRANEAEEFEQAVHLLKEVLAYSRAHFRHEEEVVFPLIDRMLPRNLLEELGRAWLQRYQSSARSTASQAVSQK